ncbi:(Fe-S)-binding protein [Salisediminibacterium beveridgei]|uniref:Glycolate oxidase iron-sulfur subunit n=1 Tax=Salisediminibacterium beveridgei TaxID=632773 RepID=A0A1D7QU54_9BACI|nr:(Fe-S)-binding protein [Salisediminibacterium beveridgei]AOM82552.1 Glycolate dehydrogenase, iron-sulfur subunit GlcF [Salisediminibacterium beveridgei]
MTMTKKMKKDIAADFNEKMDHDELLNCMRCGFCLPACPTYRETGGNEAASPRGRIALMKAVSDGIMEPDQAFEDQLSLCLGCRACEPACPSGVKYGHLLEDAVDILQTHKKTGLKEKGIRKVIFDNVFPNSNRMKQLNGLLWFYQSSGIQKIARGTKLTGLVGQHLATFERVLPEIPAPSRMKNRPTHVHAEGEVKKKVAFFSGCLMDTMFMDTNDKTLFLLQKAGCEVVIPKEQSCCGALHAHSGEMEAARALAKENIVAFEEGDFDYIISNAGGCGAVLHDYDQMLKNDPEWKDRAKRFSDRVMDVSEILLDAGLPKMSLPERIVTYQDSCHLRNVMKTFSAPRELMKQIEGVHYVEMIDADRCCGSAGTYNLVEQEMSMQILDQKMQEVYKTKAKTIVTANPGCLLQMRLGIEREGKAGDMDGVHIVDLLADAVKHAELKAETV